MQSTLNVRIDSVAKERGDRVLEKYGVSTSAAIRSLWNFLATENKLPDFMKQDMPEAAERSAKLTAAKRLLGIAKGPLSKCTDEELKEIAESKYTL